MRIFVPLLLCGFVSLSQAQDVDARYYAGVGLGTFDYGEDLSAIDPQLSSFSDTTSAWKIFGGYTFSDNFGIEGSYGVTGALSQGISGTDPILGNFSLTADTDLTIFAVRAMGYHAYSWGSVFGGAGYFSGDADTTVALSIAGFASEISDSSSENGFTGLLGVQWDLSLLTLRLEYEWLDVDNADASTLGVSAHWTF